MRTTKNSAGTTIPPRAAATGRLAFSNDESSPTTSSRLISSPTTKKKITISPSLIQWWRMSLKTDVAPADADVGVEQIVVGPGPRRVGPHQGDHGAREEQDAAGDLGVDKPLEVADERVLLRFILMRCAMSPPLEKL